MAPSERARRVLVVDDDDDIREVATVALQMVGGWDVQTAVDGRMAIELVKADPPDAILLDVMMPDMDGPSTIRHLRADDRTKDVPVILLTAKVQSREHDDWDELGVVAVIAKPFDPMALPSRVAALLGWDEGPSGVV